MIYMDTSFLAPLVIAESSSDAVEQMVQAMKPGELLTGAWTRVELASLIARKVWMDELSATEARAVRGEFGQLLDETFTVLVPTAADFVTAAEYLGMLKTGFRAGDALHLAIAANCGAKKILSLDQGMIKAGKRLKLSVMGLA